jgi:YjjG family noncanonical pyrimidine nucleotidase
MNYPFLLFDADDTLFDFPKASARAFAVMCEKHSISNTPETYQIYHDINKVLWAAFDRGEVTKEYLTLERYVRFLKALDISNQDPAQCNRDYLTALGESVFPLPYAEEVCQELALRGHQLYIVTNAVASVQRSRLDRSGFSRWFQGAFISEEAGASKPSKAYFDYVRAQLPELTAENCLIIGDSLSSDIKGANNAGLPCCWFNPKGQPLQEGLHADYEISDLRQLLDIV